MWTKASLASFRNRVVIRNRSVREVCGIPLNLLHPPRLHKVSDHVVGTNSDVEIADVVWYFFAT